MSNDQPDQPKVTRTRSKRPSRTARAPAPPRVAQDFLVVGIGASAGGLDACKTLLSGLPAGKGMACVLIQHLDPNHDSMLVDLLVGHTSMTVRQATDGMPLERDHLYVIPPGRYLSVSHGALRLSLPQASRGARLPFDFLLHSLAEEYGPHAIGVILSGTGSDGSLGLKAVKEKNGFVIAQDPDEADFDGMPRSAIMTGAVDLVLPVAKIPDSLVEYGRRMANAGAENGSKSNDLKPQDKASVGLAEIVEFLRLNTAYDFTLYKEGTLQRRIQRRMALAAVASDDMEGYLDVLRNDNRERDLLANDLFIHTTSFFRDAKVFDLLAEKIVPDLVRSHTTDQPIRIWVAGCSTGEETYSLAMIFLEQITALKRNVKLQILASDVDSEAVARAREGRYPTTIETEVSAERLARFFTKEDQYYSVVPELRQTVVFAVQDVLADPPFSRLDLISCRNLLIYLRPEAQVKVLSIFHFALREDGVLLLGNAETVGNLGGHFELISKPARLYRHIGRSRPGELGFLIPNTGVRLPARLGQSQAPMRQTALADLCRRLVIEAYAPAAVLINRKHECLYFLGPTDRYLRVAPGLPTHDLFALAPPTIQTKLMAAIQRAWRENARIVVAGARGKHTADARPFDIVVQPVPNQGDGLLLIYFVDEPKQEQKRTLPITEADVPRIAELEQELEATRAELQGAIRSLEISRSEQTAINEEALSVNEEFQSTNEELLTSKEELQSLNEELTALNTQLQETLELQRTTSNDLQNVLYSTDVATLFLDLDLNIRFFTPATKSLFNLIPSDVGRPVTDLRVLAADNDLMSDAQTVLKSLAPLDREIQVQSQAWYVRRILPYRKQDNGVGGVVITFTDVTERKHIAQALEIAQRQAELATLAKAQFLATASHDLRQPLQTLSLLQGVLEMTVQGEKAQKLVARLDQTVAAMSGMLNTMLDINQIEVGNIRPEIDHFPVNNLLSRLGYEFAYHAQAKDLALRVVPCGLSIDSDPHLLEQMIRNLLSNAIKYTKQGKVLLGCRRRDGLVSIEIWHTGIGIPQEHEAIFKEYHQFDETARDRSLSHNLGLSFVQRLGELLGHRLVPHSHPGKSSVIAIEVKSLSAGSSPQAEIRREGSDAQVAKDLARGSRIMIIDDDPEVRELLEIILANEGYRVSLAGDGVAALDMVKKGPLRPDLILADYNLPNGMNGVHLSTKLRERFRHNIPVIILTGDISTGTLRDIALHDCVHLSKPVKSKELLQVIQDLLSHTRPAVAALPRRPAEQTGGSRQAVIFVVDDDSHIREAISGVLEKDGRTVEAFATCEAFLENYRPGGEECLLLDAYLPGISGLELLQRLQDRGHRLPTIMITGNSDVPMAVQAMKAGASDFIEKPIGHRELIASVERALEQSRDSQKMASMRVDAASSLASLTSRQRQIMDMVLAGHPSKNIAADLGISQRTVENHRAAIMTKTGAKSLPALARLAFAATADLPVVPDHPPIMTLADRR